MRTVLICICASLRGATPASVGCLSIADQAMANDVNWDLEVHSQCRLQQRAEPLPTHALALPTTLTKHEQRLLNEQYPSAHDSIDT